MSVKLTPSPTFLRIAPLLTVLLLGCDQAREVSLRPVKVAEVDAMGDVSSDGRHLTYVDWSTGDLALRDLHNGEDRHLTNKGSWLERPDEWAEYSLISPDGASVAYAWHREDNFYDLRLVGIDGSEPRVVVPGDGLQYVAPRDWSPDGREIAAWFERANGNLQIVLVSVADGGVTTLKTLTQPDPGFDPGKLQFSPNGEFLAYDRLVDPETGQHDVHALTVAGGRDLTLAGSRADERILGWSPGGDSILFSTGSGSQSNLYWLPLTEGRPDGEPRPILSLEQHLVSSLGFTAGGTYFYGVMHWVNDLFRATADWQAGVLQAPKKMASLLSPASSADWSPDGRSLAWVSGDFRGWDTFRSLVVLTEETGEKVEVSLRIGKGRHGYQPRWTSGKELVIHGSEAGGSLFRIEARTGAVKEIVPVAYPETCADECAAWRWDKTTGTMLWITDGSSLEVRGPGPERREELFRAPESQMISRLRLSADGGSLAFVLYDHQGQSTRLCVLPSNGGLLRELLLLEGVAMSYVQGGTRIAWSRDGSFLLLARSRGEPGVPPEIWHVPVNSASPRKLEHSLEAPSLFGLSVHPDGRTLALTAGQPRRYEIWKLEGVERLGRRP